MEPLSKEEWRRRRRRKAYIRLAALGLGTLLILLLIIIGIKAAFTRIFSSDKAITTVELSDGRKVEMDYLTPNDNSRPQIAMEDVKGIVIHYVGKAGGTATESRDYFESLKDSKETSASSHFLIGLDGEIIQCIPLNEIAYASGTRNLDTISLEYCHQKIDGIPNDKTYDSMVELCAVLCKTFDLKSTDIIRHKDVTGLICPKYYVDNEDAWKQFLQDVEDKLKEL